MVLPQEKFSVISLYTLALTVSRDSYRFSLSFLSTKFDAGMLVIAFGFSPFRNVHNFRFLFFRNNGGTN